MNQIRRKLLSLAMTLCMLLTLLPMGALATEGAYPPAETNVAQIGDTGYSTLAAAVEEATEGKTITLLADATGDGIVTAAGDNLTIDLNGHTYTISGPVGSTGTVTNGMQLLKGSTVTIKNGTLQAATNVGIKIGIKNYANLTLEDVKIEGDNILLNTVSNCGQLTVNGANTVIEKPAGGDWAVLTGNYGHDDVITTDINAGAIDSVAIETPLWETGGATVNESVTVTINDGVIGTVGKYDWRPKYGAEYANAPILTNAKLIVNGGTFSDMSWLPYVAENAIIKLGADIDMESNHLALTKDLTIDLNGRSITSASTYFTIAAHTGTSVTVCDSSGAGKGAIINSTPNGYAVSAYPGATFTLESGNVTGNTYGLCTYTDSAGATVNINGGKVSARKYAVSVLNGTLNVNAGTIVTTEAGFAISGNGSDGNAATAINISGGTINGVDAGIYHPQKGALSITGGEITGKTGIEIKGGNATINGANTAVTTTTTSHEPSGNGTSTSGYAVAVVENAGYAKDASTVSATINGGVFNGPVARVVDSVREGEETLTITGGTFTSNPSAYVASGYRVTSPAPDTAPFTVSRIPSSGGSSRPPAPVVSDPVTTAETETTTVTAEVKPTVKGDTATAAIPAKTVTNAVEAAVEAAAETETAPVVEIKVDAPARATEVKTTLPAAAVQTLAESEADVTVSSGVGQVELPAQAVQTIAAAEEEISITMQAVEADDLSEAQQAILGEQAEEAVIIDVTIQAGDETISTFDGAALTISVPYTPKDDEDVKTLVVWYLADDGTITPVEGAFDPLTQQFVFVTDHLSAYVLVSFPFTDVDGHWAYGNVAYAYTNKLFNGISQTGFGPEIAMSRQMLWTVLARMDGAAPANYDEARAWAMENNISDGTAPAQLITREQMATILYRYAAHKGYDATGAADITSFGDAARVSTWAADGIAWAVDSGLVNGMGGKLVPQGDATRAQLAAVLQRFCQNVAV